MYMLKKIYKIKLVDLYIYIFKKTLVVYLKFLFLNNYHFIRLFSAVHILYQVYIIHAFIDLVS